MNTGRSLAADPRSLLDLLLNEAFACAIAQRRYEIADLILHALETHAGETGDETALDAAYLQGIRSVMAPPPGGMPDNPQPCRWRLRS